MLDEETAEDVAAGLRLCEAMYGPVFMTWFGRIDRQPDTKQVTLWVIEGRDRATGCLRLVIVT